MKKLVSVFILLLITSICINAQEAGFPILTNPYPDQNLSEITP